ncbi:DUF4386 domain-containing protein [Actinokineospora sp. HUAS TT18]|uniref:DUF4386 domain-containing protein n=1 Tax=Actinokineospora sp. HUAS TT18 TaxID=3447451 RepID=UPI003F523564
MNRYARLAGALYLTIITTSILSLILIESRLVVDDWAETARRIQADETLFRVGLVYDTLMFAGVIALAWSLYMILRTVDRSLALLGLLWRVAEAVVGAATVLLGVLVAVLPQVSDRAAWVEVLVTARGIGFDLVLVFLSLGSLVFCGLLYRSRYVPRWLSGLGIVGFVIMLVATLVSLLVPETRDLAMAAWAPGIVFEAGIGVWLLVKGIPATQPSASLRA